MAVVVNLEAVVDAMDLPDDWEAFLDPDTGEIHTVSDEDRDVLEEEGDREAEGLESPDWQRESAQTLKMLLGSGRALALPGKFDIHEWDLMRRFARSIEDPDASAELLGAIHGSGAFRFFKTIIARLNIRDRWFEYRDQALREMAREWLEAKGIEYCEAGEQKE